MCYECLTNSSVICNGIDDIPTIRDDIRNEMKRRYAEEGLEALCADLQRLDPEHYAVVDRKNYRRVIHALEICYQTGQTYTSFRKQERKQRPFRIVKIGLNRERDELYQRINSRVDQMMTDGLLDEARSLYDKRSNNALNTVGYKEMFAYLDSTWTLDEAIERMKGNTRRYGAHEGQYPSLCPQTTYVVPARHRDAMVPPQTTGRYLELHI